MLDPTLPGATMNPAHVYVVVPIFNEADNLGSLVDSFRDISTQLSDRYAAQFLIVDDGSTDGSSAVARDCSRDLDLVVLSHPTNRGPGHAFGTAFEHLSGQLRPRDWVLTMEGDNTSRVELLRQMFQRSEEGYDVVLASPYIYGGRITQTAWWRVLLSAVANYFVKEALGLQGIFTMSSFYRLHSGKTILELQAHYDNRIVESSGFECMIEMLIKMVSLRTTISEVPMVLDTSLRAGKSKMKVMRTILGYLRLSLQKRRWATRARSFASSASRQAPWTTNK